MLVIFVHWENVSWNLKTKLPSRFFHFSLPLHICSFREQWILKKDSVPPSARSKTWLHPTAARRSSSASTAKLVYYNLHPEIISSFFPSSFIWPRSRKRALWACNECMCAYILKWMEHLSLEMELKIDGLLNWIRAQNELGLFGGFEGMISAA